MWSRLYRLVEDSLTEPLAGVAWVTMVTVGLGVIALAIAVVVGWMF